MIGEETEGSQHNDNSIENNEGSSMKTNLLFLLFAVLMLLSSHAWSQNNAVRWYAFDAGFGVPGSLTTTAMSAIGQPVVGITQQANTRITSGFLADTLLRGRVVAVNQQAYVPLRYALHQNFPNPFNPTTTIRFEIPERAMVSLSIYNILGQGIAQLVREEKPAGVYSVRFDAGNIASGIYFYTLRAGTFIETKKLVILK
jgi:hypothetical protein